MLFFPQSVKAAKLHHRKYGFNELEEKEKITEEKANPVLNDSLNCLQLLLKSGANPNLPVISPPFYRANCIEVN